MKKIVILLILLSWFCSCKESGSSTSNDNTNLITSHYPDKNELLGKKVDFEWSYSENFKDNVSVKLVIFNNKDTLSYTTDLSSFSTTNLTSNHYYWYVIDTVSGFKSNTLEFYIVDEHKKLSTYYLENRDSLHYQLKVPSVDYTDSVITITNKSKKDVSYLIKKTVFEKDTTVFVISSTDTITFPLTFKSSTDLFYADYHQSIHTIDTVSKTTIPIQRDTTLLIDSLKLNNLTKNKKVISRKKCTQITYTYSDSKFHFNVDCLDQDSLFVSLNMKLYRMKYQKEFKIPYDQKNKVDITISQKNQDTIWDKVFTSHFDVQHYYEVVKKIKAQKNAVEVLFKNLSLGVSYQTALSTELIILDYIGFIKSINLSDKNLTILPELDTVISNSITSIDLSNNFISTIPPSWFNFLTLERIDLSNNSIERIDPLQYNLKSINLSSNNLSSIEIKSTIDTLNIARNNFKILPKVLYQSRIKNIDASSNELVLNKDNINTLLSNKLSINVSYNSFKGKFVLKTETNIENLNLSNMNISSELNIDFEIFYTLKKLVLSNNNFRGDITDKITSLHTLKYLDLSNNKLESGINQILNLKKLEYLDLSLNKFDEKIDKIKHSKLLYLNLSYNNLSGNINWIKSCKKLLYLNLSNNTFNQTLPSIKDMPLRDFNISNNNFEGYVDVLPDQLIQLNLSNNPRLTGRLSTKLCSNKKLKLNITNTTIYPCQ